MEKFAYPPQSAFTDEHIASRIDPSRKHLWLVAPPKSGSTWLGLLAEGILGWKTKNLLLDTERREQEVDWRPLLTDTNVNLFTHHQHVRASRATLSFIEKCNVKVIILSRSIGDSLVSLRDHLANFKTKTPVAFVDDRFPQIDSEAQMDFLVDLALPWYFNFYSSWASAGANSSTPILFLSYEKLRDDPAREIRRILDFAGESRSDDQIAAVINQVSKQATRKNHAVAGRGNKTLTEAQQKRVRQLRAHYSHLDFTPFGFSD